MRFRANIENVPTFFHIVQSIEKLQKRCIVRFGEQTMEIICHGDESGVQVWSQIKVASIFTDYRIQSNSNNTITLLLSADALLSALRSAYSPATGPGADVSFVGDSSVIMKLAKKNNHACLSFEIYGSTRLGRPLRITHDVRIDVMRQQDVERLQEPRCPEPDVHILLPALTKFRAITERLKPLAGDVMAVRATGDGRFTLSAKTDSAAVDVAWTGLTNPPIARDVNSQAQPGDEDEDDAPDPTRFYTVFVAMKSLTKFLSVHIVSTTTIACICQKHCLILYVYVGTLADAGGVLTFYIPAVHSD